jgi:phenylalanyl-tRNA synthetase beta chain
MKFSLSWLKEHLETDASLAKIVETLTSVGLEVESVEDPAERLAPFVVAEVLTAERHPQADKLQVLTVDNGSGAPVQVVCGAPNARAGLKGVFGAPGAYVPGSGITLKVAAIRGVESRGMMCSVRELELGDEHDGIIELPQDAPVGEAYARWAGLDDPLIDIAVTPNRPDCLGVAGIARDLAAAEIGTAKPASPQDRVAGAFPCPVAIEVEEDSGCRVFAGRVIRRLSNRPSPQWLQQRLKSVGLRPISALVDITNFFSIDRARPLHVYDVARLTGTLRARLARSGENFVALNGKSYEATGEDVVIADDARMLGFGGVMGGEYSGVSDTTTEILLESAWFEPEAVGATGRRHAILSDARARFERGVDPESVLPGLEAATRMILDLCGGEASEVSIAGQVPERETLVRFRPARVAALAGIAVPPEEQRAILTRLGFTGMGAADSPEWTVRAPSWRPDIDGEADIVEEVIRIAGLAAVPSTPLPRKAGVAAPTATAQQLVERKARRTAAARGLNEAITWSFIAPAEAEAFGGSEWVLANPISEEMKVMRPSLLPGLLAAARRNMARGAESVRLFELGRRYLGDGEHPTLGLVLAGDRAARNWRTGKAAGFDPLDAKAEALAILAAAGAPTDNLQVLAGASGCYHPGRSARLCLGPKKMLAEFGELHPRVARAFDLAGPLVAAEIFLDAIPQKRGSGPMRDAYAPSPLQAVKRDFAFILPADTPAEALLRAVRGADKVAIAEVALFDLFTGAGISESEKSLAVEVTLQPADRSFTEEELKAISDRIVASAAKAGARLRD